MTVSAEIVHAPLGGGQIARTGFGTAELANSGETASTALATQARAVVEAAFIMAMKHPRDLDQARVKLLKTCQRPLFAEAAVYAKPVGKELNENTGQWENKIAEGLSIRFAEEAARNMRNLDIDSYTLYDDMAKKIVKFVTTDLETNVKWSKTITIPKTTEKRSLKKNQIAISNRVNSYGDLVYIVEATAEEVTKREGAEASKAWRDQILKNLPADIKEECMAECFKTMQNKAAVDPEGEKKKVLDAFASIGVEPVALKEYLGHDLGSLSPAEIIKLRKIFTAIKDGESTWAEMMEQRNDTEAASNEQRAKAEKAKVPPAPAKPAGSGIAEATAAAKAKREATTKPPAAKVPEPSTPGLEVVSEVELAKMRGDLAMAAADATLSNEEVCAWFDKDELSQLNADELAKAMVRVKAAQHEPGSDG